MKRCLIISTNALGDTYLSCSALMALERMSVDIVTLEKALPIIKYFNFKKCYLLPRRNLVNMLELGMYILDNEYDYVFSFFPGYVNTFFFNISKSKIKSGFINYRKLPEWYNTESKLTLRGITSANYIWRPENNFLDRIYYSLYFARIKSSPISKFQFNNFVPTPATEKFITCNFSSRIKSKSLNINSINTLVNELSESYKNDIYVLSDSRNYSFDSPNVSIIDFSDFEKVLNLIINSEVFIGVDSFPLHIADAYNKKIVGLFSDTNPNSVFQNMDNKFGLKNPEIDNINSNDIMNALKFFRIL